MPNHHLFEDCLDELFSCEKIYGSQELSQVIQGLDDSGRERVFDLLLDWKTGVNGEWHQLEFDLLLELAPNEDARGKMVGRMVNKSERIIEEMEDFTLWSHRPDVQKALMQSFKSDFQVNKLLTTLSTLDAHENAQINTSIAEILTNLVEVDPPKFVDTHWNVKRFLNKLGVQDSYSTRVDTIREKAIAKFQELRTSVGRHPVELLQNWIGPL